LTDVYAVDQSTAGLYVMYVVSLCYAVCSINDRREKVDH